MVTIYSLQTDHIIWYVGSTAQNPSHRLNHHRSVSNDTASRHISKEYEYELVILETCDQERRIEREQYYYDKLQPLYNEIRPGQTKKQYYERNKNVILQKHKQWREENKQKLIERNQVKYLCECGGTYTLNNTTNHKNTKVHLKFLYSKPTAE